MTSFSQKRVPKARKHWTQKAHESSVRRDGNNQFHLEIEGGASQGLFPIIISAEQSKIHYESGKVLPGELLLEVNNKRVAGMTARDVTALMRRATDPIYLKTVKQNSTITKDLKLYLGTRFQKDSIDYEVQECIRKNLYQRTTPCTTRPRRDGEKHGRDYYFLTKEQFKMMEDRGDLLESGVYDGHLYGTPKPPENPDDGPISNIIGTPAREKPQIVPPNKLAPNMACSPGHRALRRQINLLKNLGPLPQNWEIDYTNSGDKYFIDHNTGSTHWLDPRLQRVMKMNPLHCEDDELPFGWQVIEDPGAGLYYVDHINRRTQYENPVLQARMGQTPGQAQYPPMQNMPPPNMPVGPYPMEMQYPPPFMQGQYPPQTNSPPRPMRLPPPVPGQQQQQILGMWPDGWSPELVLTRIEGEIVVTQLKNSGSGFGFVLVGGDSPGELLVIKDIMQYSSAEKDGVLMKGDVLVRVNNQIILMCQHQDVVQLIKSVQIGDVVEIEVRRNAMYPPLSGFPLFDSAPQVQEEAPFENFSIQIEKGRLGFGFTITDGNNGQAIKSINDAERCLKLRIGDLLVNINGQDVLNMNHQDVVSVLKSCPKGVVCNFIIRRDMTQEVVMHHKETHQIEYQERFSLPKNGDHEEMSPAPPPIPPHDYETVEFLLHAGESGFGFAIVGGANDGLPVSVGRIIPGGAAHQDGRLQIGDEITHVNGQSLHGATHQDVISLISNSSINRSIMLRVIRQSDVGMLTDPSQFFTGGPRVITLEKQQDESFGFVIQSNGMEGSIISRLLEDSPAMRCRLLHLGDMIIQVNGEDVRGMSHHDVVSRIKASSQKIALTVQEMGQEDELEGAPDPRSQLQPPSPTQSHRYAVTQNPQKPQNPQNPQNPQQFEQEIPRQPFPGGDDEEYNPQQLEEEEVFVIEIQKDGEGFGFSIHGGSDVGFPLRVMKIAPGKAADRDGRLLANDEILEINGQDTQSMMHHEVIDQIKHGGDRVKLVIRRGIDFGDLQNP